MVHHTTGEFVGRGDVHVAVDALADVEMLYLVTRTFSCWQAACPGGASTEHCDYQHSS